MTKEIFYVFDGDTPNLQGDTLLSLHTTKEGAEKEIAYLIELAKRFHSEEVLKSIEYRIASKELQGEFAVEKPTAEVTQEATIRKRSGEINSDDKLVAFLYIILRDHVLPSDIEQIFKFKMGEGTAQFSNGFLAKYADDIAKRLK